MTIFQAVILSIVEGITEFLPISSTAHLIIVSKILGLQQTEFVSFFEVFIQGGAIFAVVLLYWKKVLGNIDLAQKIIVSFIPTAIIGFFMRDIIKDVFFQSEALIAWSLIGVGILFIILEWTIARGSIKLNKSMRDITYNQAFLVGVVQAFAIVPGVSRAGAVMVILMLLRFKRTDAAVYSFLLAVPTILGASFFDLTQTSPDLVIGNAGLIAFGSIMSFIFALFFVKWLIQYLQNHTLVGFGVYRILVGLGFLLFAFS